MKPWFSLHVVQKQNQILEIVSVSTLLQFGLGFKHINGIIIIHGSVLMHSFWPLLVIATLCLCGWLGPEKGRKCDMVLLKCTDADNLITY